jgi:hypothetical protein
MTSTPGLRGIPSMPSSQDPARTFRWRRHQLMAAGLDELSAHRLAVGSDVDIHAVLTLQDTAADTSSLLGRSDAVNPDPRHV